MNYKPVKSIFLEKYHLLYFLFIDSGVLNMPIYDCPFHLKKNNRTIFRIAVVWLRCSCILGISLCSSKQRLLRSLYILYFPLLPLVLNYIQLLLLLVIVNGTMSNMVLVFILFSTDVCNSFPYRTSSHKPYLYRNARCRYL